MECGVYRLKMFVWMVVPYLFVKAFVCQIRGFVVLLWPFIYRVWFPLVGDNLFESPGLGLMGSEYFTALWSVIKWGWFPLVGNIWIFNYHENIWDLWFWIIVYFDHLYIWSGFLNVRHIFGVKPSSSPGLGPWHCTQCWHWTRRQ